MAIKSAFKLYAESIYDISASVQDDKEAILQKTLQRYGVEMKDIPDEFYKGILDAMDEYKDFSKPVGPPKI